MDWPTTSGSCTAPTSPDRPTAAAWNEGSGETWEARDRMATRLEGGLSPATPSNASGPTCSTWPSSGGTSVSAWPRVPMPSRQARRPPGSGPGRGVVRGESGSSSARRQSHAEALGLTDVRTGGRRRVAAPAPRTAWEHYSMGRTLLNAGALEAAARELDTATAPPAPGALGPFLPRRCAYRARGFDVADSEFNACAVLAPGLAECYYHRAKARGARQKWVGPRDYDHAWGSPRDWPTPP